MKVAIMGYGTIGSGVAEVLRVNQEILKKVAMVLNIPLELPQTEEGPGYGAAMLAMVGCGAYATVDDCVNALVRTADTVRPDPEIAARYEAQYRKFRQIYPALKPLFSVLKEDS